MVRAFGEWDAPVTDEAEWIEVPLDLSCMYCGCRFVEGDNGALMDNGWAQHRECSLRVVMGGIGHLVDHAKYCRGPLGTDAGLSYRQSARLVWRHFNDPLHPVTEEELEMWRAKETAPE